MQRILINDFVILEYLCNFRCEYCKDDFSKLNKQNNIYSNLKSGRQIDLCHACFIHYHLYSLLECGLIEKDELKRIEFFDF